ncbi:MAG TPA: DUF6691 family protein [Candidatus Binataceae bacterium]|jgi:hypothetical protein|nr:DUF6691 family protein [Candidatus Binataceae bacterium]
MKVLCAFIFGVIFALGLGIGSMTQPTRIIGFLDVAGHWDPTLAFVMGSAVTVSLVLFALILKRPRPVLAERFVLPAKRRVNVPLIGGAALFGIGWGLSGFCPGPALVSLVTASRPVLVFVGFMAAGLYLGRRLVGAREPIVQKASIERRASAQA